MPIQLSSGENKSYGFRKSCEAVKAEVSLVDVACRYTELRQVGQRYVGKCPLPDHDDRAPSFYVYPNGRFWCFGCSRGGDVIDLEFDCGDYGELWEAMVSLAVEFNVKLPERSDGWHQWQDEKGRRRKMLREVRVDLYQRRLFRFFRDDLALIEDLEEREVEARRIYDRLRLVARECARGRG